MRKQTKKSSALTLNSAADTAPTATLQILSFNAETKLVRNGKMEGKDWLVVPMVMIVEGVLNGSQGPKYYPAEELKKHPQVWNHKPVVVTHPVENGKGVSACTPTAVDKYKVGVIMNTKFDKLNRLVAEAWIDPERAKLVDNRVLEAIEKGETMELSTGVFIENEETAGEFDGVKYDGIARNYKPDHLAILPDQIGACSVEKGAGFVRNEAASKLKGLTDVQVDFLRAAADATLRACGVDLTANELSLTNIQTQLYGLLKVKFGKGKDYCDAWVQDVYMDFFVYQYTGKLFKLGYTSTGTKVELEGEPSEVVRVTEYRTTDGSFVGNQNKQQEQVTMNKKEVVDGLIGNAASGWKETDRATLMGLSDEVLTRLAANAKAPAAPATPTPPAPANNNAPATPAVAPKVEEVLNADQMQALNYGQRMLTEKKNALIGTITANKANKFTAEVLNKKSIDELESIAALCAPAPTENNNGNQPWFGGQAPVTPSPATNASEEVGLPLPTMNFGKDAK